MLGLAGACAGAAGWAFFSISICRCLICSGVGAGACGCGLAAGAFAGVLAAPVVVSRIDFAPSLWVTIEESAIEVIMKTTAATVVILDRNEAGPRLPKAVCVAPPPNALARSAPLPD